MLDEMQKTISMADLAKNAERIAKDIETAGTVYRVERPGRRSFLLGDDESSKATLEFIAQHPNWEQELAEARQEYRDGKYVPLELARKELGLEAPRSTRARRPSARRNARGRDKNR